LIKQVDEYLMIMLSARFNSFETAGLVAIVLKHYPYMVYCGLLFWAENDTVLLNFLSSQ
jgi:hypothetical protein